MYIDMDSKAIIVPKGKFFFKNGLKIADETLSKYTAPKLAEEWNIRPAKEMNKRQEQHWTKTGAKYKVMDDGSVEITYTWKQKKTLKELKKEKKQDIFYVYKDMYLHAKEDNAAEEFLTGNPQYDLDAIKAAYNNAVSKVNQLSTYQEVIDYIDYGV
jgi:hypothetical protein